MSSRVQPIVIAALAALIACASLWSLAGATAGNLDDSFITMVYARSLAHGEGLRWNAADGSVDGFTSLLDVLLKAALLRSTGGDALRLSWWLATGAHVGVALSLCGITWRLSRTRTPMIRGLLAGAAGLVVATSRALADGSAYLLETPLVVLLATWACAVPVLASDRSRTSRIAWALVLCLLFIARPEGQAVVVGLLVLDAARRRPRTVADWIPHGSLATMAVAYYAWHLLTFAAWAPNTYYAKSSASRINEVVDGLHYLGQFVASSGFEGLMAAAALLFPIGWTAKAWSAGGDRLTFVLISGAALGTSCVTIWAGGDCYAGGRFLGLPIVLSAFALAWLAARGPGSLRQWGAGVLGLWLLGGLWRLAGDTETRAANIQRWPPSDASYDCERRVAARLAAVVGPGGAVMQTDWQRLKFFEPTLRVVDLHGLGDRDIAHERWNDPVSYGKFRFAHALELDAAVWVYGWRHGTSHVPMAAVAMDDLLGRPAAYQRFVGYPAPEEHREAIKARYLPASVPECNAFFNVLVRRDLADQFVEASFVVGDGSGRPFAARKD